MKLMSLVILGNACQAFTSFSTLFTQRIRARERPCEPEPERKERRTEGGGRKRESESEKDTTEFE